MKTIRQQDINMIKIIVCDLDGTLFNRFKKISLETINYLINLQQHGYTLVLATGRFFYELEPYIKQLKMKDHHGYVVCCNGLSIYELATNKTFHYDYLNTDDLVPLITLADKLKINLRTNYENKYQLKVNRWIYRLIPAIRLFTKRYPDLTFYRHNETVPWKQVGKLCFLSSPRKLKRIENAIKHNFSHQYQLYYTSPFCIELVKKTVNKAYAINYICKQLNLSLDHVLAFGDGGNDELLLSQAKIGIAMKNGLRTTCNQARYLSDKTNNQDGVLDCLKKLFN
ncbi:HAD family hydrolase [uncultured Thomasclavelia sp.]|uniref:HAD family hydrolase n=1 Tax=uncultured Thomasclavelia sp. TaxID=3025759 RepID=UPI0025DFA138|nr:HAD family hydrolase [uncultured Thomasclavelia sp.]